MWKIATSIGTIGLSLCLLAGPGLAKTIAGNRLAAGPVHPHEQTADGRGRHKEGTHHKGPHEGVHRVGTLHVGRSLHRPQFHALHPQHIGERSHRAQIHVHGPHHSIAPSHHLPVKKH